MKEVTLTYNDLHDSRYNETVDFTSVKDYLFFNGGRDCEFKISWTEEEFDVYEDDEPDCDEVIFSTLETALADVQKVQREINGDDFEVMTADQCVMELLDRWALEQCGLHLSDMPMFYIDIKIAANITRT